MNLDKHPLFYHRVYGVISFVSIEIFILEKVYIGAILSFILFLCIVISGVQKKKKWGQQHKSEA